MTEDYFWLACICSLLVGMLIYSRISMRHERQSQQENLDCVKRKERIKKFKFRWHRGNLESSLKNQFYFDTYDQLLHYIQKDLNQWGVTVDNLVFVYAGYDDRVLDHIWYVCANNICIGMSNGDPLDSNKEVEDE